MLSTSSIVLHGIISNSSLTISGTSSKSFTLSTGIQIFFNPDLFAAIDFSLKPPIGYTRPLNVISPDIFDKINIHIHCPDGATPKDGPSAGVLSHTMSVLIVCLTQLESQA